MDPQFLWNNMYDRGIVWRKNYLAAGLLQIPASCQVDAIML
jgi:hypothetical protein